MLSKELIGLDTYLYTFKDRETMEIYKEYLGLVGNITEIFINNGYAFEFKKSRKVN